MAKVAVPGKASTIILVRPDATGGFEVLLTRRAPELQNLAGFLVFPGGRVEANDWSEAMLARCCGLSPIQAQQILGTHLTPEVSLAHWIAAVRELFEEVGVHFFVAEGTVSGILQVGARLAIQRADLAAGRVHLAELLKSERLMCDLSRLKYLFHRITPERYPVRFDTQFYLAAVPDNQTVLAHSEEVTETFWLPPQSALKQVAAGELPMMPPTVIALQTLAEHSSWQQLRARFELC